MEIFRLLRRIVLVLTLRCAGERREYVMQSKTPQWAATAVALAAFWASSAVSFGWANSPSDFAWHADDSVLVTANRSERATDQTLARVDVLDREAIARSQARDLLELLQLQSGIDITRTGGPGGQTSIFLRGSNSNHVLVLVDGVRVAATGTGGFAWELLDVALIERIEIVRGPRAARWGSDAIGGVIHIFTRRPDGVALRAGIGRYTDRSAQAAIGGDVGGLAVAARKTRGFSAQNERGFAFDPDDDGFALLSASAGASHVLPQGQLNWQLRASGGEVEFDQGVSDLHNHAVAVDYRWGQGQGWQWQAAAAHYRDRLDTETAFGASSNLSRRSQLSFIGERAVRNETEHTLLLLWGADGWHERGINRGRWSEDRRNLGLWVGLDGRWRQLDHEFSLRVDEDQRFGTATSGTAALGHRFGAGHRGFISVGRAFRAPNFNQLFSEGFFGAFAGNPDLDPETAWSAELGLDLNVSESQQLTFSAFQTRIDDLIDFSGENFGAININRARIRGLESQYRYRHRDWQATAQYTWQQAIDRDRQQDLLRRPQHKASVSADRMWADGHWLGLEVVYQGQRLDIGNQPLSAYTLVHLRGAWQLSPAWRVEARWDNLGNKDYEPLIGFNAAARSLFVALHWQG